jgi:ribose 5-phosphate isomerase B
MCIAANKVKGIRAALCWNKFTAKHARTHLDANVLCLSGLTKPFMAKKIIKTWLQNRFIKKKKYIRRLNKIKRIEI